MIAVFARYRKDFVELRAVPNRNFKMIRSIEDLAGYHFDGVVFLFDWYYSNRTAQAYEHLRYRQPELFEKD